MNNVDGNQISEVDHYYQQLPYRAFDQLTIWVEWQLECTSQSSDGLYQGYPQCYPTIQSQSYQGFFQYETKQIQLF